ncbi:methyltransferase domain-containing protein [Rasiella sp. SM2506]|uniref:methyltransferase domain-containing protein n=1 Tax=Rasiella sp. SM2506 TaxID=3423914 RepID=UPI003D7A229D
MISYSTKSRSKQEEILDNFELHGPEMEIMLNDLKTVNKILGGQQVTLKGIKNLLQFISKKECITIVDIGCGDGEMLRKVAQFGEANMYKFNLIGIDGNEHIIKIAKAKSKAYPNISFHVKDIFSEGPILAEYDIVLCTLFLHHFKNEGIIAILNKLSAEANVGVVVNDLHRSRIAFWLFRLFSSIFINSKIARHDGLVSVARGFKHRELMSLAAQLPEKFSTIQWNWAFRWQWIIKNTRHD